MGRILVVHPRRGLLELIKGVLGDAHAVEGCEQFEAAMQRLDASEPCAAVLCTLNEPRGTVQVFEKAFARSPTTRLIPIARDANQVAAFWETWNAVTKPPAAKRRRTPAWLPERCTAGEIIAVVQAPIEPPVAEQDIEMAEDGPTTPSDGGGRVIDGYQLLEVIGRGGFGTTWLAVNQTSGKRVAVKIVEGEEQVRQELAALRKYVQVADRSEHLLQIEHINRDAARLWMVTPLADSLTGGDTVGSYKPRSLANWLQTVGHIPELEAAQIAISLIRALLPLHQAGLLHGDVSPANILSRHNRWVLADPGLVRFQGEAGICRDRAYYPQPQVTRSRDDLYAVGLILWEMVSGVAEMVSGQERLRLDAQMLNFLSRKAAPTANFLRRAAAENPEQRYLNVGEILHDLEALAKELASQASSSNSLYDLLRPLRTS